MFHGVRDAWMSASETNMADVKELVPEFFYLPEFLLNDNRFDLGKLLDFPLSIFFNSHPMNHRFPNIPFYSHI